MQGIDSFEPEEEFAGEKSPTPWGRLMVFAFCVLVLLRAGLGLIDSLDFPPALEWLHPLSFSELLNGLVNGIFYLSGEGNAMMRSLVRDVSSVALSFLIIGGFLALAKRTIRPKVTLGLISLMLLFVLPSHALEIRKQGKGQGGVTIGAGETVDDTLVVFGNSVTINGTITGDLIAFARQVNVQGTVQGNIFVFGQKIDVSGTVEGDAFEFGQMVQADGKVGKNLWGFGSSVTIGRNIRLDNDATLFSGNAYINGDVGRDATVFSGTLDVGSKLGRDLRFRGGQLMVHPSSAIGRNLYSTTNSAQGVQIDPSVTIGGKKIVEFAKPKVSPYLTFGFYVRQVLRIAAAFLLGLFIYWISPTISRISISTVRTLLISGGIGFLAAVAIPIAAIILAITLIGLPIGLVGIAVWLLGLYLSKIVIARCIGGALLGERRGGLGSTAMALLIGLLIVIVAVNLPYIGGVLNFVLMLIGLGALTKTIYSMHVSGIPQN